MTDRVCVVGKGLFGVAAGRHLARSGFATIVVGPDEPADRARFDGPFGAHHDEARVLVARGDEDEVGLTWATIAGMEELESATGAQFMTPGGVVEASPGGAEPSRLIDSVVRLREGYFVVEESAPQGWFNPRAYIRAALDDARTHGTSVVAAAVREIRDDGTHFTVAHSTGTVECDRVVVAAGAWSNRFLEPPLELRLKQEYVVFAEMAAGDAAAVQMRPVVVHGPVGELEDVYVLPPTLYPDGRWYVKLGANTRHDQAVDATAIDEWYRSGDSDAALEDLCAGFAALLPKLPVTRFHTDRCVITYSDHGRPYIDEIIPGRLYVACAGNGHGASFADGVGSHIAKLATNTPWAIAREAFTVRCA